jgi:ribose-phosphate pyrophosphokinase
MIMVIVPGPSSQELGYRIAELLKQKIVPIEFRRFPDGESYIRFDADVRDEDVTIVQTTGPPQNENLVQLLLMADTAKTLKAKTITTVVPYFAYARQDQRFRLGEAFSVKTIVHLLETCGVNKILTVNSHNPAILKSLRVSIEDLSAVPLLAEHFKKKGFDGACSLALGKKGLATAVEADKVLGGGSKYISTQRDRITGKVTIEEKPLPVKGSDVIIFDDIISSGGTMMKAVAWTRKQGARTVHAACVHPLLIGDAENRILQNGADSIVGTDSVPSHISVISVAPLIAKALFKRGAKR